MAHPLPKFRKDLRIVPRIGDEGQFRYLVKDLDSEAVYELGEEEYFLCRHFDGRTSLESIKQSFQKRFGITLRLDHLRAFIRYLRSLDLMVSEPPSSSGEADSGGSRKAYRLFNPDRQLAFLSSVFSWCFTRIFMIFFFVILTIAIGTVIKYTGDFIAELPIVRESIYFFWIPLMGIFILNPLTEIAKGTACKHHGRAVQDFKVYFNYRIIPTFFCEISDAMWLMNKSERIRILSSGLVCQTLLWAIGIIGWKNSHLGTLPHSFWTIFILASTLILLLKFNPLLERDGYYLLSAWLEIPYLKNRAKALIKSWILRKPTPEPLTPREVVIFKRYGLLSEIFKFVFWCLVIGFIGYNLMVTFKGVGACMFIVFLFLRFENTIKKHLRRIPLIGRHLGSQAGAIKPRLIIKFGLLVIFIILMLVPYPFMAGGDFRVLPARQVGIRSQVTSEIETVFVTEGQWVKKGDPIVKLSGRDQKKKVEATQAALDQAQANLDLLLAGAKPEAIAAARQEVQAAAKSLKYSTLSAERFAKLVKDNAASQQSYENALKIRDLDRERLELARRNLELIESGARKEEIESLEARVRRLKVELGHAKGDLELILLTSPIAGRIITPHLDQKIGQILFEGDMFAVVEDAEKLIAELEVPEEDIGEVRIGSRVTLRPWGQPTQAFKGKVVAIAPVAYEKTRERSERALSEREWLYGRNPTWKEKGRVVRVLTELPNEDGFLKTGMTGYAKIDSENKPVIVAFTRWLVRFLMIEVWSWIP